MTDCERAEQFVCISCVEEVRYSFVSHLSEALRRKGINSVVVGVDSDDVLSKESQAKVEKARVSVMVLPGNCEPTTVCLDKFVECQRNNGQVVVPVLYGDSPLQGEWLTALDSRELSPIHQSRKECSDSKLVEEIVRDVYEKLFHMGRIGIYSKLQKIENMVCKQPFGIRRVGIWGMPGIGKTTLAKAVFDQMSGYFDAYCFIQDYEKSVHEKGIYLLLEEQLFKENLGTGDTITKPSLLTDKSSSKRVLVVLDDVHNPLVAASFFEGFDWFSPGSLIIITSRDKQVFRLCRINQIYEVQGLNEKEALQLFFLCASIKDMGEQNLHELSVKVINYANGNPLAISIYGREMKGKKKLSEMETAFLKLRRRPPLEIVDAVKSSYDTLSDSEKNIFLDIACFFRGENVDYVMQLFEGCGFFPHVGIDALVEKCMMTISENRVQMENLIQDVGREIIMGETIQIERRSRLWEPWSIKYLLEDNERKENGEPKTTFQRAQGTEDIEGMFLDTSNLIFDIKPVAFESMLSLRLLKIYNSKSQIHPVFNIPKGFFHSLPDELRLLHWENYPLQSLPQYFDPGHLVEINMPYSQLQKLWGGTKNMEMLKTIRLSHSRHLVDIDDILKAPNLEVVDLQGCIKLQSFPPTGQLLHLRVVILSGCTEIKKFPEIPPNIETLHLQGTCIRKLPHSIVKPNEGELVNLLAEFPGLSDALKLELTSLAKSSSSSRDLGKLICLDLKDCSRLQSLPNMGNLEFLKVLDLSGCSELEIIQGFPRNLKELYIAGTTVREVPQLPQSLELLYAHGCVSLKSICLDRKHFPMHYTFSNCFSLSPQVVSDFLVKVLDNVKHIPREHPQELNEALAFSFCAPSQANQDSTLDLQLGSSVMKRLNPSWRNTLVGFAMLVEVAFSEDYNDGTGFGISCVCRWKNKKGHSHRIERHLHCWAAGKAAPKVQKDHMFVFCDAKMRLSTGEGNDPNILADLVVFEFFPVHKQTKRLDDTCTVTRCGVYAITGNTDLKMSSPVLFLDPMEVSGNEVEEVLRVSYDGLQEIYKALFLYIACLFNDEDFALVAPLISSIDVDISSGLKALANRSLIRVSSNGEIVMHCLLRQMGKEILHKQSMLPGSSKDLTRDFEKDSMASSSSRNWKCDVFLSFSGQDVSKEFLSHFLVECEHKLNITFKNNETDKGKLSSPLLVQAIRESRISIVVFSKKYASSSWLLNELVEIAKCKQELGQYVIPIFYNVDPSEVRQQTGEFGRHFKQTYKGKSEDEKQQWQQALTGISNIVGYNIANWDREASMTRRFHPTDEEIVDHYLRPKNLGSNTSVVDEVISTVDIYSFDPWELPSQSRSKSADQVWYFFGCRKEQHNIKSGDRHSRKTKSGFWKKIGVTMDIMRKRSGNRAKIGEKRLLVFHFSKILGGSKFDWVMHEYHATFLSPPNRMMTTYTICKLMFKGDEREMIRDHAASMIEKIVIDVSNKLGRTTSIEVSNKLGCMPSTDFLRLVGIEAHLAKLNSLLCLESEEVKMVGIWGPSGIGKSTIARFLYDEISSEFEVSAYVDLLRDGYNQRGHMDGYGAMMYLQQLVLSQIFNQTDIKINHLGSMQERLKDQNVLIILDGVDDQLQLDALAGNIRWFGPRSRIIVITIDLHLLKAHGINYIYEVGLPSRKQALQMLCQYAFGQNSPRDGFMELATEVAESAGNLPLGLRVFGSYLRGMHQEQWLKALPRLRNSLGGEIESILKVGYDGLCDEDKDLFLHISCLFNHGNVEDLKRLLTSCFLGVKPGLKRLADKSIIDISEHGNVTMHHLQQQLGREIVRRECFYDPGKRRFLVDSLDICNVLAENTGTRSVVGISLDMSEIKELIISERGFDEMINLQFLKFYTHLGDKEIKVRLPHGLDFLSHKLRLLHWEGFPMRCMPSNFIPNYLVELTMVASKLEELWSGIQPLQSLKCMNLRGSLDLREISDLTYATNLETLDLGGCSSLTKLPSSIGNLHKLKDLDMERCIYLEVLPTGINLESLYYLNLNGCSRLTSFPQISRCISDLYLDGTAIEEVPWWIENISGLFYLSMNGCNKLRKISPNISKLKLLVEVDFSECRALTEDSWPNHPVVISTSLTKVNMTANSFERLPDTWTSIQPKDLDLSNCRNLVSLPELPASLSILKANFCESLESLHGSFDHRHMALQFINCFKLNHQAREFILHSDCAYAILPGRELPAYFTHRVDGNFLTVTLPRISLSRKILSFKACMVVETRVCWFDFGVIWFFRGGKDDKDFSCSTNIYSKKNHLIIFNFEFSSDGVNDPPAELNYGDVQFEFFCHDHTKEMIQIKECGIRLLEVSPSLEDSRKSSVTEDDDMCGESDAEASRSRKKMRIT